MEKTSWLPDAELEKSIEGWIAEHREEIIKDIRELVAVPSVSGEKEGKFPFGAPCGEVLDLALKKAKDYGFDTENYDYYCGGCRMKGSEEGELGMFAHLDVVPIGEGWEYPPLECTEKDGYLIGRGVGDNKGPAVAALYAMRFLKEHSISLKHDVLLYFGCSEEKGMGDIEHYVEMGKLPDFSIVPDTDFSVCYGEKGIFRATVKIPSDGNLKELCGGSVVNVIPAEAVARVRTESPEKAELLRQQLEGFDNISANISKEGTREVTVKAKGLSRHAAFPEGSVNALHLLAEALCETGALTGKANKAVKGLAVLTGSSHGETTGIEFEDKETGKLTCCGTVARLEEGILSLSFDVRYPASFAGEQVREGLGKAAEELGFELVETEDSSPSFVSPERPEIKVLCEISDRVLGKAYKPYTMGGGTYARHLTNAVGFGPGIPDRENPFPAGRGQGHQPDECIAVKQLTDGCKAYVLALLALDKIV